jgi:hypothetical protein
MLNMLHGVGESSKKQLWAWMEVGFILESRVRVWKMVSEDDVEA